LNILNDYAVMLKDHHDRFGSEERGRYLGFMASACRCLDAIPDQFQTAAALQGGAATPSREPVQLQALLGELPSTSDPRNGTIFRLTLPSP